MNVHGTQPNYRRGYGVKFDTSSVNPSNSVTCGSISLFLFLGVCLLAACVLCHFVTTHMKEKSVFCIAV